MLIYLTVIYIYIYIYHITWGTVFLNYIQGCIGNVKVDLDLFNQTTKASLKGANAADTSNLAAKSDLTSLKTMVDK